MTILSRRLFGVVLLPLLILAGPTASAGWFCANGSPCEPAFAPACCCTGTEAPGRSGDCCAEDPGPAGAGLTALPCGCYYEAADALPAWKAAHPLEGAFSVPAAAPALARPPILLDASLSDEAPPPPPRRTVSIRDPRGPPPA